MGGGNRRSIGRGRSNNNTSDIATPNNPKSRKKKGSDVKTALFVEVRSSSSNNKFGSQHRVEGSPSKSGLTKSSGATIGYNYPSLDYQDLGLFGVALSLVLLLDLLFPPPIFASSDQQLLRSLCDEDKKNM
ncbi:hypothetical protein VNO80_22553 [Phaseolus coccineus]|uniref:Uncharacterized protein n=1 Tax=Phaseolus coccineus TaxID=3886 RepID=A0AAN9QRV5_PHACN